MATNKKNKWLLKNDFNLGISIAILASLLLISQNQILMSGFSDGTRYGYGVKFINKGFYIVTDLLLGGRNDMKFLITIIYPVLISVVLFRYLHVKKMSQIIFSLPMKKMTHFKIHVFSGVVLVLIPYIMNTIHQTILAYVMAGEMNRHLFYLILSENISICIIALLIFMVGTLMAAVSGITIVQVFFTYIALAFLPVMTSLGQNFISDFIRGFEFKRSFFDKTNILNLIQRERRHELFQTIFREGVFKVDKGILIAFLLCVIVLMLSYYAYKKRKVYKSGEFIALNGLNNVFIYGFTISFVLLFQFVASQIFNQRIYYLLFDLIALFIGFVIATTCIYKKICFKKHWRGGAVVTSLYLLLTIGAILDFGGYQSYVPVSEQVEGVIVDNYLFLDSIERANSGGFAGGRNTLVDGKAIDKARELHQAIIDGEIMSKGETRRITIVYLMKDGGYVFRKYEVNEEDLRPYLQNYRDQYEVKKVLYSTVFEIESQDIQQAVIKGEQLGYKTVVVDDSKELSEFHEALKEDILNTVNKYDMYDGPIALANVEINFKKGSSGGVYNTRIYNDYTKTKSFLEQHGYLEKAVMRADDLNHMFIIDDREKIKRYGADTLALFAETGGNGVVEVTDKEVMNAILNKTFYYNEKYMKGEYKTVAIVKKYGRSNDMAEFYGYVNVNTLNNNGLSE